MPHIMIVNRLEANKERVRPVRLNSTDQTRLRSNSTAFHSIPQFDQKVRPLSFRPEKFGLFTATFHTSHYRSRQVEILSKAAMI